MKKLIKKGGKFKIQEITNVSEYEVTVEQIDSWIANCRAEIERLEALKLKLQDFEKSKKTELEIN
jgi:uncharacterized small protein (DUF1192 family)